MCLKSSFRVPEPGYMDCGWRCSQSEMQTDLWDLNKLVLFQEDQLRPHFAHVRVFKSKEWLPRIHGPRQDLEARNVNLLDLPGT
jgi:hypothetical protein